MRLTICLLLPLISTAQTTWTFDRLDSIGGHRATVEGDPKVIATPKGKAVQFDGDGDAIFLDVHPLAGVKEFTWEVIFRPDADGRPEQRFFHMQETGSQHRLLMETRLIGGKWCLDSFAHSPTGFLTLLDRTKLWPLGEWHHAATVYDGKELRNYVNGVLQGSGPLNYTPNAAGRTSIGVRINRIDYFKGAVRVARMSPRALAPSEFLKP